MTGLRPGWGGLGAAVFTPAGALHLLVGGQGKVPGTSLVAWNCPRRMGNRLPEGGRVWEGSVAAAADPVPLPGTASVRIASSCMGRASAQCPPWTWPPATSALRWCCTPRSPRACALPSQTPGRPTALTLSPSERWAALGSWAGVGPGWGGAWRTDAPHPAASRRCQRSHRRCLSSMARRTR